MVNSATLKCVRNKTSCLLRVTNVHSSFVENIGDNKIISVQNNKTPLIDMFWFVRFVEILLTHMLVLIMISYGMYTLIVVIVKRPRYNLKSSKLLKLVRLSTAKLISVNRSLLILIEFSVVNALWSCAFIIEYLRHIIVQEKYHVMLFCNKVDYLMLNPSQLQYHNQYIRMKRCLCLVVK